MCIDNSLRKELKYQRERNQRLKDEKKDTGFIPNKTYSEEWRNLQIDSLMLPNIDRPRY